jgi:hypothetical protein
MSDSAYLRSADGTVPSALALALTWLLTACGPIYRTTYSYTAPDTLVPRACIHACGNAWDRCHDKANDEVRDCEISAERDEKKNFEEYKRMREGKNMKVDKTSGFFNRGFCSSIQSRLDQKCRSHFDNCYTSCGGTITPIKECILFCD